MADNSLKIFVEFERDKSSKPFNKLDKEAADKGAQAGSNFGRSFSTSASSAIKSTTSALLKTAVAVIGVQKAIQALSASVTNLRGFERGVAEINSILPKNQKLTEEATQRLIEFSTQFGSNQQNQARAFYNIVSAGVKGTANQLETLEVSNRAAVAGLVDIDTSAKAIVSSVNAYSKKIGRAHV